MKLCEVIIALSLSVFILAMVGASYLTEQTVFHRMEALMQMQENMRIAAMQLSWALHSAGYRGCGQASPLKIKVSEHEFTVYTVSAQHATVQQVSLDKRHIMINTPIQFHANEVLLISDCQKSELIKVDEVERQGSHEEILNIAAPLQNNMIKNAEIYRFITTRYFVECKHQHCGLYLLENNTRKLEWIPNVKSMSLSYLSTQLVSVRLTLIADQGREKIIYIDSALRG